MNELGVLPSIDLIVQETRDAKRKKTRERSDKTCDEEKKRRDLNLARRENPNETQIEIVRSIHIIGTEGFRLKILLDFGFFFSSGSNKYFRRDFQVHLYIVFKSISSSERVALCRPRYFCSFCRRCLTKRENVKEEEEG